MVRCHISLLPMNSHWQQDFAQGKPLLLKRNNSRHLSWPDDLRKMHSGSLPGSGPPSGNRLWHREYLSLLSRCPDGRMLEVGQTSVRHGRSEKGRGGERWHSRWTPPPKCSAKPCATPSSATRSGT